MKKSTVLFADTLILLLLGWPAKAQDSSDHLQLGLKALATKEYDGAAGEFRKGLNAGVKDKDVIADLNFYLGIAEHLEAEKLRNHNAAQSKELWLRAQQALRKATNLRPESSGSWNNLGLVSARLGDVQEAKNAYQRAIELGTGDHAAFLLNYADLLADSKGLDDALRFYQEAAIIEPSSARARKGINAIYLTHNRRELVSFVWRLFDEGHLDWATEAALSGLESSPTEREAPSLLSCVVRCLARKSYDPGHIPQKERLIVLGEHPIFGKGIVELFRIHESEMHIPEAFAWWATKVDVSGKEPTPIGGWPQNAFTELIRALGERSESRKDLEGTERYYRLAYELTPDFIDPVALIKLSDLWMKMGSREKLNEFLSEQEHRIFSEKGHAILKQNHRRTYEIHRSLAMIYMHLDRWESVKPFHNAEFQLRAAIDDTARFNATAAASGRSERLVDIELVERLSNRYEQTGRPSQAFALRVNQTRELQRATRPAEAAVVFKPLIGRQPPEDATEATVKSFQSLQSAWQDDRFKTPRTDQGSKVPVRTPAGVDVRLLVESRPNVRPDDVRRVQEIIKTLVVDSEGHSAANRSAIKTTPPVRLLPKFDHALKVDKIQFDGRQGVVDLKVDGRAEKVRFSIDGAKGQPAVKSFKYVKP